MSESLSDTIEALTAEVTALREELRQLRLSQSFSTQHVVYVPQPYPVYPQPHYVPLPYWYGNQYQPFQGSVPMLGGGRQT